MTIGRLLAALVNPQLLAEAPALPAGVADLRAGGIAYDSRRVAAGSVFVALRGQHADGTAFAPQAVARGAAVVVAETNAPAGITVPWITVADARLALALLASRFYLEPSESLDVVGITGTNGKTTTAYVLRAILEAAGRPCSLLGTVINERYPQLQSQSRFADLMVSLEGTENRIRTQRRDYNEAVQSYNTTIRTFPDAIGAKIFYGAKPKVPFEAAAGAQEAPKVEFNTAG